MLEIYFSRTEILLSSSSISALEIVSVPKEETDLKG